MPGDPYGPYVVKDISWSMDFEGDSIKILFSPWWSKLDLYIGLSSIMTHDWKLVKNSQMAGIKVTVVKVAVVAVADVLNNLIFYLFHNQFN